MKVIKYRVSLGQITLGYESVMDGTWFASANGTDWENGTYTGNIKRWLYTGIQDKNNKEIYEGDIITYRGKKTYTTIGTVTGLVEWDNVKLGWRPFATGYYQNKDDVEVIGNIYQNPELVFTV